MKWPSYLLALAGVMLLLLGVALMTVWEIEFFRATTFDRDFTGLVCGTPLDNPGWATGSPCHGAVNRQTGVAIVVTFLGIGAIIASIVLAVADRRNEVTTG
jgi:hypothetical protein